MNDEMFQRILDEIKSSSKTINVLPLDEAARQAMKEKYRIKSGSLMAAILENTGGIVIDNWIRLYGSGELNFVTRNSLFPFNEIVIGEDILGGCSSVLTTAISAIFPRLSGDGRYGDKIWTIHLLVSAWRYG